ncbi:DUF1289 domain-containing protein [Paracoccus caeni]|uniref:DUF1289 domain-containing protein n=2 Tax=Paracoccus caeni TaxID=657651 RepID=A0A934SFT3_9RHOB|nr:DUF1289 domain-containing protein [Paracoccus caeni]
MHPVKTLCIGCYRSIDEIIGWAGMTDQQRRRIMAELPARKPLLDERPG